MKHEKDTDKLTQYAWLKSDKCILSRFNNLLHLAMNTL